MGIAALILAIILYFIIAIQSALDKDYPHCMIWVCYGLANLGFLWHMLERAGKV